MAVYEYELTLVDPSSGDRIEAYGDLSASTVRAFSERCASIAAAVCGDPATIADRAVAENGDNRIAAIKQIRGELGCTLREAKDLSGAAIARLSS